MGTGDFTSTETVILQHCLANNLGVLPDPLTGHHWYSLDALAELMQREKQTVANKARGLPRHPRSGFVRLVDFVKVADAETPE